MSRICTITPKASTTTSLFCRASFSRGPGDLSFSCRIRYATPCAAGGSGTLPYLFVACWAFSFRSSSFLSQFQAPRLHPAVNSSPCPAPGEAQSSPIGSSGTPSPRPALAWFHPALHGGSLAMPSSWRLPHSIRRDGCPGQWSRRSPCCRRLPAFPPLALAAGEERAAATASVQGLLLQSWPLLVVASPPLEQVTSAGKGRAELIFNSPPGKTARHLPVSSITPSTITPVTQVATDLENPSALAVSRDYARVPGSDG